MKTTLVIGSSPAEEDCAQVGEENYERRAGREIRAFCAQLRRMHGAEPGGALLIKKENPRDFGWYYEAAISYNSESEEEGEYAAKVEGNLPAHWDDEARKELGISDEPEEVVDDGTPEPFVRDCFKKAGADPKKSEPQIKRIVDHLVRFEKDTETMRQRLFAKEPRTKMPSEPKKPILLTDFIDPSRPMKSTLGLSMALEMSRRTGRPIMTGWPSEVSEDELKKRCEALGIEYKEKEPPES